jgi:preprotein translocase subunit SecD
MRRVGLFRVLLVLVVVVVSFLALFFQSFDISVLGSRFQRGNEDTILGMRLGLDLQGGVHLIYQARGKKELSINFLNQPDLDDVQAVMDEFGKPEAVVGISEDGRVTVEVNTLSPEVRNVQGAVVLVDEKEAIRQALEEGTGQVILSLDATDLLAGTGRDDMEGVLDIITRRINPFGVTEPILQIMGDDRILIQLPGIQDVEEVKDLIGQTAHLVFMERTCSDFLCTEFEDHETGIEGKDLVRAFPGTHPDTGAPIVNVTFNSEGTRLFALLTQRLAGTDDRFVVFLDDDELIAPLVNQPILSGSAFIEGPRFTVESVRTISIQLESGRLPIPIEVIQEQNVDAILGAESLRKSFIAGVVGLALVLLFMVIYYRAAGVVAAVSLVIFTATVLTVFKLVPVTLTLAGIGAFILSIGMAVDANILIFERMKEELRLGRTLASAVEIGFARAWPAIRDANVSTLITSAILFWFGQRLGISMVSGFALTLGIGILLSMFSAVMVSKMLLVLLSGTPLRQKRAWFTPESLSSSSSSSRTATATAGEDGGDS